MLININKFSYRFIVPKIILVSFISFFLYNSAVSNFNEKIYGDRSGSGASRVVNTVVALNTIYNNPLIGTGFYFKNYTNEISKSLEMSKILTGPYVDSNKIQSASSTSSFLRLYSQFGIPIALFFTLALFKQTLIPKYKSIFAILIIASTSSAPLMFFPFYFIFIVSGILNITGIKISPIKNFNN